MEIIDNKECWLYEARFVEFYTLSAFAVSLASAYNKKHSYLVNASRLLHTQ